MLVKEASDVKSVWKVDWTVISGVPNSPNQVFDFVTDCIWCDVTALTLIPSTFVQQQFHKINQTFVLICCSQFVGMQKDCTNS